MCVITFQPTLRIVMLCLEKITKQKSHQHCSLITKLQIREVLTVAAIANHWIPTVDRTLNMQPERVCAHCVLVNRD